MTVNKPPNQAISRTYFPSSSKLFAWGQGQPSCMLVHAAWSGGRFFSYVDKSAPPYRSVYFPDSFGASSCLCLRAIGLDAR